MMRERHRDLLGLFALAAILAGLVLAVIMPH
jgi:hypothetical protein